MSVVSGWTKGAPTEPGEYDRRIVIGHGPGRVLSDVLVELGPPEYGSPQRVIVGERVVGRFRECWFDVRCRTDSGLLQAYLVDLSEVEGEWRRVS